MSQQFVTSQGLTLTIPAAYPFIQVQQANAGLSANGIVMLVGESDQGPDFTLESDVSLNSFGPGQLAQVVQKYKSGNLVDAFRAVATPANDPNIVGAPTAIVIVKTNQSVKASGTLTNLASTTYGTLFDKSWGKLGNLINYSVATTTAETTPTTGNFTWINNVAAVNAFARSNGNASTSVTLGANTTPVTFVSTFNGAVSGAGVNGLVAAGGTNRSITTGITGASGNYLIAVTANVGGVATAVTFTLSGGASPVWGTTPSVGDTVYVPQGSAIQGGSNQNVGAYVVTTASTTTINATKLSDANKTGGVAGTITNPANVSATQFSATPANDIQGFAPVSVTMNADNGSTINPIDGYGKNFEFGDLGTGADQFVRYAFQLNTTPVTWISVNGTPKNLTSATELGITLSDNRQVDAITETFVAGGKLLLSLGYTGTTATATVTITSGVPMLTTSVVGGTGANLSINLTNFPTINDLATFINAQTGYTASVGTTTLGQLPCFSPAVPATGTSAAIPVTTTLDQGTFNICTTWGAQAGRIKDDAYAFFQALAASNLVQLGNPTVQANSGLPVGPTVTTFLTGGSKGGTLQSTTGTGPSLQGGIDALQRVTGNFIVPLFSQDATSDITIGATESSSNYTIDAINSYVKTHVLAMSTTLRKRNRQAFLSKRNSFQAVQTAAANLAAFRCSLCFQDFKLLNSAGVITQFQPWMGAVLAAGMQAAGFYRNLTRKVPNMNGALQGAVSPSDFSDQDDTAVTNALNAGLLVVRRSATGQFYWVSDQTTYSKDSNFVFNSIQAIYAADVVALTSSLRMETAFVGQSVADVSAGIALAFLKALMTDFLRLKLLAVSDDAPQGFKNATIQIQGPAMIVSIEIKLAGAIYFIPITFSVTPVQQSASL